VKAKDLPNIAHQQEGKNLLLLREKEWVKIDTGQTMQYLD
jgi:hypothetical protein